MIQTGLPQSSDVQIHELTCLVGDILADPSNREWWVMLPADGGRNARASSIRPA